MNMQMKVRGALRGFTLVELLGVIAILAILATLSMTAVNGVLKRGKMASTEILCKEVVQGVDRFYLDYSRYPVEESEANANGVVGLWEGGDGGKKMLYGLLGEDENGNKTQNDLTKIVNFRYNKYVEINDAENRINGVLRNNSGVAVALMDAWGKGMRMKLDFDFDGFVDVPTQYASLGVDGMSVSQVTGKCIVFSLGADKDDHTKDDVVSWD